MIVVYLLLLRKSVVVDRCRPPSELALGKIIRLGGTHRGEMPADKIPTTNDKNGPRGPEVLWILGQEDAGNILYIYMFRNAGYLTPMF